MRAYYCVLAASAVTLAISAGSCYDRPAEEVDAVPQRSAQAARGAVKDAPPIAEDQLSGRSLRLAHISTLMATAPGEYRFEENAGSREFAAGNDKNAFSISAGVAGLLISAGDGDAGIEARLKLHSFGRRGATAAADSAEPAGSGNRVEYRRGAVTEWYRNGEPGVEQGFTIERRPAGEGELELRVEVGGSHRPAVIEKTGEIVLVGEGRARLRYSDLFARDVTGRLLPASMTAENGAIVITVDDSDALYPVEVDPLIWGEQAELTGLNPAAGDWIGNSVAVSGTTVLIGAPGAAVDGKAGQGVAYVYVYSTGNSSWALQGVLKAAEGGSSGATPAALGSAVALDGDWAVVGAENADGKGAVYIFRRSQPDGTWSQHQKLTDDDLGAGAKFGCSVSKSGKYILAGAKNQKGDYVEQGAALLFSYSNGKWAADKWFTSNKSRAYDHYGASVANLDDLVIIGSPGEDYDGKTDCGAVYERYYSFLNWWERRITSDDGGSGDNFGASVSIPAGDTLVAGSPGSVIEKKPAQGAIYVFYRQWIGDWGMPQKYTSNDGVAGDRFGASLSVNGNEAIVGADSLSPDNPRGAAYVFSRSGDNWAQTAKLLPADGSGGGRFGMSVGINGDLAVVGAGQRVVGGVPQGAAYVFRHAFPLGDPCNSDSQCVSGFCADKVCCNERCADPCERCNLPELQGGCMAVPENMPDDRCPISSPESCQLDGLCSGKMGVCQYYGPDVICDQPYCDSQQPNILIKAWNCDGSGNCLGNGTVNCTPYLCNPVNAQCFKSCTVTGVECAANYQCVGGVCLRKNGQECKDKSECASGKCADGYCCNDGCTAPCERCNLAGKEGKCSAMGDGKPDPDRCPPQPASTCGNTGLCTAAMGVCALWKYDTVCVPKACDNSNPVILHNPSTCNGAGVCVAKPDINCTPYICDSATAACFQSCDAAGAECAAGFGCDGGKCVQCGDLGEICCFGGFCDNKSNVCSKSSNHCVHCGAIGELCCGGNVCTEASSVCSKQSGMCSHCGLIGELCCEGNACAAGYCNQASGKCEAQQKDGGFDGSSDGGKDAGQGDAGAQDGGIPDGGTPDAGEGDTGLEDAANDSGMTDAGLADAESKDVYSPDGGVDAGVPDAGGDSAIDAGVQDAAPDAGPADGGTVDAGGGDDDEVVVTAGCACSSVSL